MRFEPILDALLIPRPNGSQELERTAYFIRGVLEAHADEVALLPFRATPHGFELVWWSMLLLVAGYLVVLGLRRYGLALGLSLLPPLFLLAEFELLWSPISGLVPATEHNVVGTFSGRSDGPTLILAAHYDTTTHFGDHLTWPRWAIPFAAASALAPVLALAGLFLYIP